MNDVVTQMAIVLTEPKWEPRTRSEGEIILTSADPHYDRILVAADWYDEQGEQWTAAALRYAHRKDYRPLVGQKLSDGYACWWATWRQKGDLAGGCTIPATLFTRLPMGTFHGTGKKLFRRLSAAWLGFATAWKRRRESAYWKTAQYHA